ncbi:anthranilate synthase component I family protein [Staphylococcus cohnii]|uniref:chorismate-binding protein n=1 Tax=Staphylococcus TaxID=1279 RepID=UPI000619E716|nr:MULTISPECIES: anthranilate synthase component I family protein [Staphylococcus]AQM40577.1 aminodeoxychorismate synthase component I [Staphylococcus cohnii]KKD22471.1 aminobenzoate synthetase [Staphylococcus cohnii subsp. cohnii]KKD25649.1 aminobenzoate synthetase [Staphylococcus cohnii subsp. cohnii]MBM9447147.1 anthranilate synthase component I family protein [Staphylococcus ureilyticus]MCQ9293443.1 anthranilate synthase component I family protein [Staphylococcus cohnii]
MQVKFNYQYYINETQTETYQYLFKECLSKKIAYQMQDVGEVIRFAELHQSKGKYVALYLPYEAASYFNNQLATITPKGIFVYAAAYVFESVHDDLNEQALAYQRKYNFKFQYRHARMIDHIKQVQKAIVEGNTYQVNYTTRLSDDVKGPISELYHVLQGGNHGHYSALIDTKEVQIASLSPELFFQFGPFKNQSNIVLSKPMKGTIARGETELEDKAHFEKLRNSTKDRAENVMIVDLLRNDISRVANTGTVKVYQPFHIERYQTVYQMTSMVTGQLANHVSLAQVLEAIFPCGSITGAPKVNTMKYIKQLEQTPRNGYCGTIGLLLPDGKAIFNVPIRTIQYINGKAVYGVGAGITIDSNPESEVQEFIDKTKILERL